MGKPYVVSSDIRLLLEGWVNEQGFTLPSQEFFQGLRAEFSGYMRRIFPGFELVSEEEIMEGITHLITRSGLPAVSLDQVYFRSEVNLEITRLVDSEGKDRGLGRRAGTSPLLQQIRLLQRACMKEVLLVDDVVFTGALLEKVIELFSRIGIRVPLICVGIGIAEGIRRINHTQQRETRCVRAYDEVIDEVCERDFYPGVPLSGRLLTGGENIGVPYLLPFGNPESWASIPSKCTAAFSKFCLRQTTLLFEEIEWCSNKIVCCRGLGRGIIGLPKDSTRYVNVLRQIL